jgi:hypothetical protein
MIIGYARVPTTEQNLDLQRNALKRAVCEKIIEDTISGGKVQRPGLGRVHDALRSGDVLAARPAGTVAPASYRADGRVGVRSDRIPKRHRIHRHDHTGRQARVSYLWGARGV